MIRFVEGKKDQQTNLITIIQRNFIYVYLKLNAIHHKSYFLYIQLSECQVRNSRIFH